MKHLECVGKRALMDLCKGGETSRGETERGREGGREQERGEERQVDCAQCSFKLTEAVCVLVCTFHCSTVSQSLSLSPSFLPDSLQFTAAIGRHRRATREDKRKGKSVTNDRQGRGGRETRRRKEVRKSRDLGKTR